VSALQPFLNVGCTGITGIGARVRNVTLQVPPSGGDCEMHVEVIEPQGYANVATGPELAGSRHEFNQENFGTGERLFVSASRTGSGIPIPRVSYFVNLDGQVEGGLAGRICDQIEQEKDTIPGLVFTRAHYKTSGWRDDRKPGVARISGRTLGATRQLLREPDENGGGVIQGDDYTDVISVLSPFGKRIVTKGDAEYQDERCILVIETAFSNLNLGTALSYLNTVNANALSALGLPAGTCRMLGPSFTRWWLQGALFYFDYHMLFDPAGHNNCESQLLTEVVMKVPDRDEDGVIEDPPQYKSVVRLMPFKESADGTLIATKPEGRKPFITKNWSELNGWITWT
jgi:hypothetical protein